MNKELTHDELAANLAQYLLSEDRMVWEDIPVGPSGSIRPDVYTIQKSFAKPNPMSYEIKVSVSDFRSDITSGKWQQYLDFSYGVVFCVPKGLITKKDVPISCGLMTFNGEFWNTVKKPTIQPANLNSELLLKLLIGGNERQSQKWEPTPRDYDEWKMNDSLRKKWGQDIREKLALIEEYPTIRKELRDMRKELCDVLNISVKSKDLYETGYRLIDRNIDYEIKKIMEAADESSRKKKIAGQLEKTRDSMVRSINHVIDVYTKGEDDRWL